MTPLDDVLLQNFALAMIAIANPFGKVPAWVDGRSPLQDDLQKQMESAPR